MSLAFSKLYFEISLSSVDKEGKTVDFLLTAKRDKAAAKRFFEKASAIMAIRRRSQWTKVGPTKAVIDGINQDRKLPISVRQIKCLNNIVEQDHRAIILARPKYVFV